MNDDQFQSIDDTLDYIHLHLEQMVTLQRETNRLLRQLILGTTTKEHKEVK
jgi:hypothetical protein